MIRKYTIDEYKNLVSQARSASSKMHISTDLIVGFPGETEEEFEQTLQTLRDIRFGDMHLFRYSPRQGTPASRLPRHVPKNIASQRFSRALAIQRQTQSQFQKNMIGRKYTVLWERDAQKWDDNHWIWQGYTENYVRIKTISEKPLFNQLTSVHIDALREKTLMGSILHS